MMTQADAVKTTDPRPGHPTWVIVVIAVVASILTALGTAFALSSYEGANNDKVLCKALNGGRKSVRVNVVKPLETKVIRPISEFIDEQPGTSELSSVLHEGEKALRDARRHLQSIPCP